jgi:hypothetical protein
MKNLMADLAVMYNIVMGFYGVWDTEEKITIQWRTASTIHLFKHSP